MNIKYVAAACAGLFACSGAALAQMTPEQQQLVQTMRPMQAAQTSQPVQENASTEETSYGGTTATRGMSASGHRQGTCSAAPNCDIFFGQ